MCIPVGMLQYFIHLKKEWIFEEIEDYDES